jgi:hypothetical protein
MEMGGVLRSKVKINSATGLGNRRGPDFSVAVKIVDRDENGLSMVVPHDYQPNPKFLTMVGAAADPQFGQDPYEAGGVRMSPVNLEVVVTGHRNQ